MTPEIIEYIEKFNEATGKITVQGKKCPPVSPSKPQIEIALGRTKQRVHSAVLQLWRKGLIKAGRSSLVELVDNYRKLLKK